jgi:hypothetical protein
MDLTLLWVGIGLIVVGFFVGLIGLYIQKGEPGTDVEADATLPDMIAKALKQLFTSVRKMFTGSVGDRVQAFGSVLAWAGVVVFIVWIFQAVGDGENGDNPPTPGA